MRLIFMLVLTAATLSASCDGATPMDTEAAISKVTSPRSDAVVVDDKRILRTEVLRRSDQDREERAGGNLGKVDDEFSFMINMFKEWDDIPLKKIATSAYRDKATPTQFAAMMVMYKQYQKIGAAKLVEKLRASTSK
jgi:hypothetical protein